MFRLTTCLVAGLSLTSPAFADHREWRHDHHHHHHHHRHHHHDHYPHYREEIIYIPERVVEYVPVQPRYYAPPPVHYQRYDQRTSPGLVGGMIGSVIGYEMGLGDPVAAGLGAAAGAWFGNGMY